MSGDISVEGEGPPGRRPIGGAARLAEHVDWALRTQAFELHYQDIRSLSTGRTSSREALLRWRDPDHGVTCNIQTLIEVAEASGQIAELGAWVLETACREAAAWPDRCCVTVNVSPRQLLAGDFAVTTLDILAATGLPPEQLGIEITETAALSATPDVVSQLTILTKLGITLALDDFGVGYSSLKNLQLLPFNKIKIDRCFLWDALHNDRSREIISAVVALGRKLKMTVAVEGVETHDQLELLRAADCDLVQGYLFSRPRSQAEVLRDCAAGPSPARTRPRRRSDAAVEPHAVETSMIVLPVQFVADLSDALNLEHWAEAVMRWCRTMLRSDRASIALAIDEAHLQIVGMQGNAALPVQHRISIDGSMVGRVFRTEKAEICNGLAESPDLDCRALSQTGLTSCMDVPLRSGGRCYGTLNVARYSAPYELHEMAQLQALGRWLATQVQMFPHAELQPCPLLTAQTVAGGEGKSAPATRPAE